MSSDSAPPPLPPRRPSLQETRRSALAEVAETTHPTAEPGPLPPHTTTPPRAFDDWGVHGPPPTLDAALLTRAQNAAQSPLFVLVAEGRVPSFLRSPDAWVVFNARRESISDQLGRNQRFPGPTQAPSQTFSRSKAWDSLRKVDEATYPAFISALAKAHQAASLDAYRDEVERRIVDDMKLTLAEQFLLGERARDLAISDDDAQRLIDERCRAHGIVPEKNSPLRRRNDGSITNILELRHVADVSPDLAIEDLKDAIKKDKLEGWLKPLGTTGRFAATAERIGKAVFMAHGGPGLDEAALDAWCWELIWDAGIPWLDLGWQPAATRGTGSRTMLRVESIDALLTQLKSTGADILLTALERRLLSPWLNRQTNVSSVALLEAERWEATWSQFAVADKSVRAQRVAWALGDDALQMSDKARIHTAAKFTERVPGPWLVPLVEKRLLHGWLEIVLRRPDVADEIKLLGSASHGDEFVGQFAQWRLGRRHAALGAFHCSAPSRDTIIEAALRSESTLEAFGTALVDGRFGLWVRACGVTDPRLTTLVDWLRSAGPDAGSEPRAVARATAQTALVRLGERRYPVFVGDATRLITDLEDLVAHAHESWSSMSVATDVPRLANWLKATEAIVQPIDSDVLGDWPVGALLMAAGDSTMRSADGTPVGLDYGRRFGGASASDVRADFVRWLDACGTQLPASAARAALDGGLKHWLRVWDRPAHDKMVPQLARHDRDASRILTTLWAIGYSRLIVNARTTVKNAVELASCARENLSDIERLFDDGLLESWATGAARERLERLSDRVDDAMSALAALDVSADAGPPWVGERLGDHALYIVSAPTDWLIARDRAALAVAVLGGVLAHRVAVPEVQAVQDMPLDTDLELPVHLGPVFLGDVPTHGILRTLSDKCPRSVVTCTDDAESTVAHFTTMEVDGKGRRWRAELGLLQPLATGDCHETRIRLDVTMAGTAQRLANGLKRGAMFAALGALTGGAVGWLYGSTVTALLPSLTTTATGFDKLSAGRPMHGLLGLFTVLAALAPFYVLIRFGRRATPVHVPAPQQPPAGASGNRAFKRIVLAGLLFAVALPVFVAIGEDGGFAIWNSGVFAGRFFPDASHAGIAGTALLFGALGALTGHVVGMLRARATTYALGSVAAGVVFLLGLAGRL